jgi:hypothetical protein
LLRANFPKGTLTSIDGSVVTDEMEVANAKAAGLALKAAN